MSINHYLDSIKYLINDGELKIYPECENLLKNIKGYKLNNIGNVIEGEYSVVEIYDKKLLEDL